MLRRPACSWKNFELNLSRNTGITGSIMHQSSKQIKILKTLLFVLNIVFKFSCYSGFSGGLRLWGLNIQTISTHS